MKRLVRVQALHSEENVNMSRDNEENILNNLIESMTYKAYILVD